LQRKKKKAQHGKKPLNLGGRGGMVTSHEKGEMTMGIARIGGNAKGNSAKSGSSELLQGGKRKNQSIGIGGKLNQLGTLRQSKRVRGPDGKPGVGGT